MEERIIHDAFGLPLHIGDTICFTLSMRIDQKPIVKAKIADICYGKKPDCDGVFWDWIVPEYIESSDVSWATREKKLLKKVTPSRVVKCY